MCGIAGYLRLDGAPAQPQLLREMEQRLAHRGPDGAGILAEGPLGFAHRRLSIIDLDTGAQPMERDDLGRAIVFNGEIYNYVELREELVKLGHRFHTTSDTEVLLVGHAAWGEALLPKLRGMFAFALWERGPKRLTVARDPLGKKPLQIALLPGRLFAFASEAKALFALPEISRAVEPEAIAAYLDWMYVPEQLQLFRDIGRLQAGELLVIEEGRARRGFYAADSNPSVPANLSFDEACARVDAAVREATRIRLRADVPLGVFLSGGIDSTLVALAAAAQVPGKLRTYTVAFRGEENEGPYAAQVARAIGSEHTELSLELDAPAAAMEILRHFDEPFGDSSAVPVLAMSRETSRAVKVVLSGDGGDEIFGGYGTYLRHLRQAGQAHPAAQSLLRKAAGRAVAFARDRAKALPAPLSARIAALVKPWRNDLDAQIDAAEISDASANGPADSALQQLLMMRITRAGRGAPLSRELLERMLSRVPRALPSLRAAMRTDRLVYLPGDILKKVDICAMRAALEVRSPLLDDDVIALADALPQEFLVDRVAGAAEETFGKRPLKALVAARLGSEFAYRPKQGFGAPIQRWLRDPRFVSIVHEGFASPGSPIAPWFAPGAREQIWRDFSAGKSWLAQEVWNLIALDAWARETKPS